MVSQRWLFGLASALLVVLAACGGDDGDPDAVITSGSASTTSGGSSGGSEPVSCDDGTVCDNRCVDLDSDPSNCGACGRTCVIPDAEAACEAGECRLGPCESGYADCDGDIVNGCEAPIVCEPGGSCTTSCNSQGTLSCSDVCSTGTCQAPVESCNLVDDDCDGSCDEEVPGGCRVGVHRSSGPVGHFYTTDAAEATVQGNKIEAQNYFYLYKSPGGALRPLFRCLKGNGKTLLTTKNDCDKLGSMQATVGFIAPQPECGADKPLYRLHHPPSNNHFYTLSAAERDNARVNLGYIEEGITGFVWAGP